MKNKILQIAIICCLGILSGQEQNKNWIFGNNLLSFDDNQPNGFSHNSLSPYRRSSVSVVSNKETGDLLFYSDGIAVYNKNHQLMDNGRYLFGPSSQNNTLSSFYSICGIRGGNDTHQGVLSVPLPGNPEIYYVFSLNGSNRFNDYGDGVNMSFSLGLRYAIVDMTYNNGLGKVITKNNSLINTSDSNGLTATLSSNGQFYWIITSHNGQFYSYRLTENGLDLNYITSPASSSSYSSAIKVSPNGKYLFNNYTLYDFNNATGRVSSPNYLFSELSVNGSLYRDYALTPNSFEFSENSNIIYFISSQGNLCLYPCPYLHDSGISMYNIEEQQLFGVSSDGEYLFPLMSDDYSATLQRAPNGKIYLMYNKKLNQNDEGNYETSFDNDYWGVINTPNDWNTILNPITNVRANSGVRNSLSFPQLIGYQPSCLSSVHVTEDVQSGDVDFQSASNTIFASNEIHSNANVAYDAGSQVILRSGFIANTGSNFRAYIEGCVTNRSNRVNRKYSVKQPVENKRVKLYPNPTSSILYAEDLEGVTSWSLNDLNGNVVRSGKLKAGESKLEIRTQNLSQGIYYFNAILKNGKPYQESIIIKH